MKLLTLLFILSTLLWPSCKNNEEGQNVILVILAHPDDETTIGPMMRKYARQNKVIYIVATDGRYGVRTNNISADSLVEIRKAECECSARALGIDSLILLGFHDGFGIQTGIEEYFLQTSNLKKKLKLKIEELDPDFILTFGPDGDTGHSDHRIIGDIITEIILREGWVDKFPLYYLGWTKDQASKFGIQELGYVDPQYFNISISFSQEDENKYFNSIRCYKSQYTAEEIEKWIDTDQKDTSNILYFRKLSVDKEARSGFNN